MLAFALVIAEPLADLSAVGVAVLLLAALLYVLGRVVRAGVMLVQTLRGRDSGYEVTIQHGSRVWRKVLVAGLIAVALSGAAVRATSDDDEEVVRDCSTIPPWTIEWWWYCSGNNFPG